MKISSFIVVAAVTAGLGLASCAFGAPTPEEQAKRQARSVHLIYDVPQGEKAVSAKGTVTVVETQTNSYYAVLGWDCGYCGLQDKGAGGKILIFSVWDESDPFDFRARPENTKLECRAELVYSAPQVNVARFGGEGTGVRTITDIGWRVGEPITVRIDKGESATNRLSYTCFYRRGNEGDWQRIAEISTVKHVSRGVGFRELYSFVEDFWRNVVSASLVRRAEFSDIAVRLAGSEEWQGVTRARFSADSNASMAIDAGRLDSGRMFLQTGGPTVNAHTKLWGVL